MASAIVRTLLVCRASSLVSRAYGYQSSSSCLVRNCCVGIKGHEYQGRLLNLIGRKFSRERKVGNGGRVPMRVAPATPPRGGGGAVSAVEEQVEDESDQEEREEEEKPTRNASKRQSKKARDWGRELANLAPAQLRQAVKWASLEEDVYEAVMIVKNLGKSSRVRNGRRRQYNYIGGLLRNVDPELMESVIKATKDGDVEGLVFIPSNGSEEVDDAIDEDTDDEEQENYAATQEAEAWLHGLIGGIRAVEDEVYSIYDVDFDRQELRKLVREARKYESGEPTGTWDAVEGDGGDSADLTAFQSERQKAQKKLLEFLINILRERQENEY